MHSEGYCSWVCLSVSVCLCFSAQTRLKCLFVPKMIKHVTDDADQMICRNFAINTSFKVMALFAYLQRYFSGILRNFPTAELSKALKRLTVG